MKLTILPSALSKRFYSQVQGDGVSKKDPVGRIDEVLIVDGS